MIYFIQAGENGPIKIGQTDNGIEQRVAQLQTGCPYELKVLWLYCGNQFTESEIHTKFKHEHIRGEWFRPSRSLLIFIDDACENSGVVRFENKNEMVMATEYPSGAYRVQAVDFDAVVNDDSLYLTTTADKIEIEIIGKVNIVVENGEIFRTDKLGE